MYKGWWNEEITRRKEEVEKIKKITREKEVKGISVYMKIDGLL
jgi:hypothetical protein